MESTIRVNSARLGDFVGRDIRIVGKLKTLKGDSAIIESSDGGQVEIKLHQNANLVDPFVEIIGNAIDSGTIKYKQCLNLGSDLDLKLIDQTIELMHDPKFSSAFM